MRAGFVVVVFLFAYVCPAVADMAEVYRSIRQEIMNRQFMIEQGYCYSFGQSVSASASELSKEMAVEKADLIAREHFFNYFKSQVHWPEDFSPVLIQNIWDQYRQTAVTRFLTTRVVKVDSGQLDDDHFFVVLGTPEENISKTDITFDNIRRSLDASVKQEGGVDFFTYLEICPAQKVLSLLSEPFGQLQQRYGNNADAVIRSKPVVELGRLWEKNITFSDEELRGLSIHELFSILDQKPYDPAICYFLAERFFHDGYPRSASLFYSRGTIWPFDNEYRTRCTEKMMPPFKDSHRSFSSIPAPTEKLKQDIAYQAGRSELMFGVYGALIIKGLGQLPLCDSIKEPEQYLEANKLFFSTSPRIELAFGKYVGALQEVITADICNMIGRCLQLQGDLLLAVPFYYQAVLLNKEHPYACANLAVCLHMLNEKELTREIARAALKNPKLSDWGRKQIEEKIL